MSNFTCGECYVDNLDNESGYYQGCAHWPPERDGRYLVVIKRSENASRANGTYSATRIFENGKWDIQSFERVIVWSEINA